MQFIAVMAVLMVLHQVTGMSREEWIQLGATAKIAEECRPFGIRVHWGKFIS